MHKLSGIIPPVVTPLLSPEQLDVEAVDRLVDHLINGSVSGLFVLGTTGEGPSVTYQIRYEMVERTCEATASRVPVLVGITDTSFTESVQLAEHARSCGATAVVAAAPYYFPVDQNGVIRWFQKLADASPLPLLLYNMPMCVDISLTLQTVEVLSAHHNIIGVKDSSGDLEGFGQLCDRFRDDDFVVFMGPEELIPEAVAAGADGGVCGGGNLLPQLYVNLFNAACSNDTQEVARLSSIVKSVYNKIYTGPDGNMNIIAALKLAMSRCRLCRDVTAPPLAAPTGEHTDQVNRELPAILLAADSNLATANS